jgi:hypothetical protein
MLVVMYLYGGVIGTKSMDRKTRKRNFYVALATTGE